MGSGRERGRLVGSRKRHAGRVGSGRRCGWSSPIVGVVDEVELKALAGHLLESLTPSSKRYKSFLWGTFPHSYIVVLASLFLLGVSRYTVLTD